MLTLHEYAPSQNAWKVRALLGLLGIPFRSQPVAIFAGESRTPEFLAKNPVGAIPVLELEDGRTIAESNAILCYLAEGTRFMPTANAPDGRFQRAKVMQWLFFEQYYVEPVIGSLRFWTLTGRLEINSGLVPSKREAAVRALAALERTLGASLFLAGTDFTIADIATYAYAHLAGDCAFPLAGFPAIARWVDRVGGIIGPGHPVIPYGPEAQPH
ncbi:MAG TPA: glutathione S-transferase family protein [Dongiaceae bacterium]|jgi:glutathione S-transferase|nr:glutathione S-transferase family protein [Dongiaceae bacterium]